jgi:hypothetical protein
MTEKAEEKTTETTANASEHQSELGDDQLENVSGGLQNAENVRSQAEKRLEQQRKDLTRNWGG